MDENEASTLAQELVAQGYVSVSNKYRLLAKLPEGKTAVQVLQERAPEEYARILERIENQCRATVLRVYGKDLQKVVPGEVFTAFKKLGGGMA